MDVKTEEKAKPRKRKYPLSLKQKRLAKTLGDARSIAEAGKLAGYGTPESTYRAMKGLKESMPDLMERLGLTDEYVVEEVLKPGLKATVPQRASMFGKFTDERIDPDYRTRGRYMQTYLTLKGHLKNGDSGKGTDGSGVVAPVVINLGFIDPARAEAILRSESVARVAGPAGVGAAVDENRGREGSPESV